MAATSETIRCCCCGNELPDTKFYRTSSQLYSGLGKLPICKQCLERQFLIYEQQLGSEKKALQRICMAFDIYHSEEIYRDLTENGKPFRLKDYMSKVGVGKRGKTYDSSMNEIPDEEEKDENISVSAGIKVPKALMKFWGPSYEPGDYQILQEHYDYLCSNNPNRNSNQEIFIRDLCTINLMKIAAQREKNTNDYSKLSQLYVETFKQAGLNTKEVVDESDTVTVGNLIKMIQDYTPADYYADKTRYCDMDGFDDYFNRMLVRPMKNLMTGSSDRDYEYCVPDEEE